MKHIIIPYTKDFDFDSVESKRVSFAFLHGKLENDVQYDVFGVKGKEHNITEGIHACTFKDKDCTLFYWSVKGLAFLKGLCVYNDDKEAYAYAEKCYKNKEYSI